MQLLLKLLVPFFIVPPHDPKPGDFNAFCNAFVKEYRAFDLPPLVLSYVDNLKRIKAAGSIQQQTIFFESIKKDIEQFNPAILTAAQQDDYYLIQYETNLNIERLALEKQWNAPDGGVPTTGLYTIPNGKKWYAYFLKKWVAADVTPDMIYNFGLDAIEYVKQQQGAIQKATGLDETSFYKHLNDDSFFINDQQQAKQAFEKTKAIVIKNMPRVFNVRPFADISIIKGADENLAQTPGYYSNNTFYFNYFDKPYNKRQVDWLFIHEAVPGHHYQLSIESQANRSAVQQLFHYFGFSEGWAAYTEGLGKQLGVYQTVYDELGKWEWDIVRSVRVPLDVGINYYGWTDEQALAFWKKHIRNQDDIALREIARIKRWPAQVVTYKYGAAQIEKWKTQLQQKQGNKFDIKTFHDLILSKGSLPLFLIEKHLGN
jgi:uncharacterized protein (DUF885 family)